MQSKFVKFKKLSNNWILIPNLDFLFRQYIIQYNISKLKIKSASTAPKNDFWKFIPVKL